MSMFPAGAYRHYLGTTIVCFVFKSVLLSFASRLPRSCITLSRTLTSVVLVEQDMLFFSSLVFLSLGCNRSGPTLRPAVYVYWLT